MGRNATEGDKSRRPSVKQRNAIDLLIGGATEEETATRAGVARQTVSRWLNHDPLFQEELLRRREAVWERATARAPLAVEQALLILEEHLKMHDPNFQHKTALDVLRLIPRLRLSPAQTPAPPADLQKTLQALLELLQRAFPDGEG